MKRRSRIRLISYALCAALALGGWSAAESRSLSWQRRDALYGAGRAFEESVNAVSDLSEALAKAPYAADGGMCARICSEIYAKSSAAEGALSVLPFATQELEQLSAFLNVTGDYAWSLCADAAREGFSEETVARLKELSVAAADFSDALREMQRDLHAGDLRMDSREKRLRNVGAEPGQTLSARLLDYQSGLSPMEPLEYDGKFGCAKAEKTGYLTEEEQLRLAADYAGTEPEALDLLYRYEGIEGRRCFRTDDLFVCVSRCGVESMTQARLVGEAVLDEAQAQAAAEAFLARHGYEALTLRDSSLDGAVLRLVYCAQQEGAVCPDNALRIAVALDDGSIYAFDAGDYCADAAQVRWPVGEEAAAAALPEGLQLRETGRCICKSEGLRDTACYRFSCTDGDGRNVTIYVDAATGRQWKIEL